MQPLLALGDEVTWRGRPLVGDRVQTLLAVLVAHAPETVSDERLISELWGAALPASPGKALQVVVSRARSMTDKDVVERHPAGYRLGLPREAVDLLALCDLSRRASGLLRDGDSEQALGLAQQALLLAPGEGASEQGALADVRAEARRHAAGAARVRAMALSASGRHDEALLALIELSTQDPEDETLLAALLVSEASVRGASAALARYERHRARIADLLGTDPAPALRRLHKQLLDADHPVRQGIRYAATPLIGRGTDLARLQALVRSSRVTSILGPGGLGKTRLAHVLGESADQSVVHFVELASVRSAEDVVAEVGSVLGVRDSVVGLRALTAVQRADVESRIAQQLDQSPTLLILDNCEHVVDAVAGLVARLVGVCRDLRVLTTTRAPLGIAAEHVYPLGSLRHDDGVVLFRERALAARPDAVLEPQAIDHVVERLDGLPLAMELAAAKVRVMSVEDIGERLADRFALLRGRDRSAPDRHQTLEAVIDWSWHLLVEPDRRAMSWLSVFHDGFTLAGAEALLGSGALGSVESLADQSLVVVRDHDDGVRYRMLETVRDFGRLRLAESGEAGDARRAQRSWAVGVTSRQTPRLFGSEQIAAVDTLRDEEANLVDVLHQSLADGDTGTAVAVVSSLGGLWSIRGEHTRATVFAEQLELALADWEPPDELRDLTRAALVALISNWAVIGADTPNARGLLERLGPGELGTYVAAATRVLLRVHSEHPVLAGEELLPLTSDPDPLTAALALQWRAQASENSGDPGAALSAATEALRLQQRHGGPDGPSLGVWGPAMLHTHLAHLHAQLGRNEEAAVHAQAAIPVLERLEALDDLMQVQAIVAIGHLTAGRIDEAEELLRRYESIEGQGLFGGGWITGAAMAEVALARGEVTRGLRAYDRLSVELAQVLVPGLPMVASGYEPWIIFGESTALTAHARHASGAEGERYVTSLHSKLQQLLADDAAFLDLPIAGMAFFALGSWSLHRGVGAPDTAAHMVVLAERMGYPRSLPTLDWSPAAERAQALAPGAIERWQAAYGDDRGLTVLPAARAALRDLGDLTTHPADASRPDA